MRFDGKQEKERISKSKSGHRERRFRKNRHITNRIQQKTVFEATDLSEKYYARRIKAVMHLLPEMKKRYAAKYPEMDMVSEFAEAASFPSITYDIIDWQMDVCLGAAVWLLDRIWEQEKMQQLCDLLPKEDDGAELPVIYDTRFSEELLGRTKNVAANRYGEGERHIIPPTFFDRREGADTFHAVLALVPDEVKEQAAAHLRQKFWNGQIGILKGCILSYGSKNGWRKSWSAYTGR